MANPLVMRHGMKQKSIIHLNPHIEIDKHEIVSQFGIFGRLNV